MNLAFIGLGRLGFPTAIAFADAGHHVIGYDVREGPITPELYPYEKGLAEAYARAGDRYHRAVSLSECWDTDALLIALPTPCRNGFDPNDTRLPDPYTDHTLDDSALVEFVSRIPADYRGYICIVSTTMPGTTKRLLNGRRGFHMPSFAGMGTVVPETREPEMVVVGCDDWDSDARWFLLELLNDVAARGWVPTGNRHQFESTLDYQAVTTTESETIKLAVNTMIGLKIGFANTLGELCDKMGDASAFTVMQAIASSKRIASGAYLKPGMGDGGGCHIREDAALTSLCHKLGVKADPFRAALDMRRSQAEFLAGLMSAPEYPHDKVVLGRAFKEGVNIETGAHALQVVHALQDRGINPSTWEYGDAPLSLDKPCTALLTRASLGDVATSLTSGSVLLDPHNTAISSLHPCVRHVVVGHRP